MKKKKKRRLKIKGNIDAYGIQPNGCKGKISFSVNPYRLDTGGYEVFDDRDVGDTGHNYD